MVHQILRQFSTTLHSSKMEISETVFFDNVTKHLRQFGDFLGEYYVLKVSSGVHACKVPP